MSELNEEFTVAYFIRKFEAIPEEQWTGEGCFEDEAGRKCAFGHCGVSVTTTFGSMRESECLADLFRGYSRVLSINDGRYSHYQQSTPRARILAALRDIKEKEGKANE